MKIPRLRIFAGPNGSGKSTLFDAFTKNYPAGIFVNADVIEQELTLKGFIDLQEYGLSLTNQNLIDFLQTALATSLLAKAKAEGHDFSLEIVENILIDKQKTTHFYEGAIISAFLRAQLQAEKADFSFETVMSHPSKIDFIQTSKNNGYKTYLYFICIDDPEINISRVNNRVEKGGHPVSATKIERRYFETLSQLMTAIESCDTTFLFDNSGKGLKMIAKIVGPSLQILVEPNELPNWFLTYVLPYYQMDPAE